MVHMINGYKCGYRMAIIEKDDVLSFDDGFEHLYIEKNKIRFSSDNSVAPLSEKETSIFADLHTGDIVCISERGICYVLYNQVQGETVLYMGGNCNSNCLMCPAGDSERRRDYSGQWQDTLKLIDMLPDRICYYVITGGEPTLNKEAFLTVVNSVKSKFVDTGGIVLTNGRSFSSRVLADEFVQRAPEGILVAIPIHGSTEKIHDSVTQAPGSFRQSLRGIRNLLDRNISVEIRIVVTKLNCEDTLSIAKLITDYFPDVFRVNFISLEVRGSCLKNQDTVYITPRESFDKSRPAIDHLLSKGMNVELYNYPLCNVDREYWLLCKKSIAYEKAVYSNDCEKCDMKDECGGLFISTLKSVQPKTYPITFNRRIENIK